MPARFNFPLFLTWLRIVAIPAFVAVLYVPEDWIVERTQNIISMWIFIGAAVTDWLDGYLARKWNQTTSFGAFLDPVADKLMVAAALIVLTEKGIVDPFASLIIIGREITVSALREWMAQIGQSKSVAVNIFGKIKTVGQLVAIPFLLYNGVLFGLIHTNPVGRILIWIAAFITLWSMVVYLKAAIAAPPEAPK
ncbi:MAG: CDP-diacylglycerol--glycerol-3-phosphate 3-phosphatidyltransferase [Pseudomonadota bacterium]|nr:CDP-diacylglycerol--glycerol-3-phosphate 3-phosphatidyltransferase [Pseudomonadota bacterium]